MYKEANTLAKYLLGTNLGISQMCDRLNINFWLFVNDCEAYDILLDKIGMCESCGFWHKRSELNDLCGEFLCNDCLDMEVHQD